MAYYALNITVNAAQSDGKIPASHSGGQAVSSLAGNVMVGWDQSVVTKKTQLIAALKQAIEAIAQGYGGLA